MNVEGPILLIPKHAFSPDLMVGDIGHLTLTNSICYDGQEGTLTHMRQLNGGLNTTESVTGTAYGDSASNVFNDTSGVGVQGVWKLSPQASSLSTVTSEGLPTPPPPLSSSQPPRTSSSSSGWFPLSQSLSRSVHFSGHSKSDNSIFGSAQASDEGRGGRGESSTVEEDRKRVEKLLEIFRGPCLLDCIEVSLMEVDVFSAKRVPATGNSFKIERQNGNVLKEKGAAKLFIERNLYEDFCRDGRGVCVCVCARHVTTRPRGITRVSLA